jgi:membrane protein implicated in regulation of membrane protease activity
MIIATLLVGGLTAYWFGLRAGGYAAAATFGLLLLALFVPHAAAQVIYLALGAGVLAICLVGPRRTRPPDAVLATRWVRRVVGQVVTIVRRVLAARTGGGDARRDRENDRR